MVTHLQVSVEYTTGDMRSACTVLVGLRKIDAEKLGQRHNYRYKDNIKIDMRIWIAFVWLRK
jgi:hypothetical protein